jgi:glycosyltransferase involved in cell wall biosynthesis
VRIVVSSGSRTWGGLESMAEALARGLHARGHRVTLFCRRDSPLHRRLRSHLPCEPVLGGERLHPLTLARCVRALRRHRADAVIGNTMKDPGWTGAAARILGVPYVYRHELNLPYPGGPLDRLLLGRAVAAHVVNSASSRGTVLESAPWLPPERVRVIPNGVDPEEAGAAPADPGLPAGALVFGFVGRWEEQKGIRELLEAWPRVVAEVPSAHLALVGWGAEGERLRAGLRDVPHLHWLGFRDDVPALMRRFDVLVAPFHREGFGLVLVEAMAVGTAVVASDASSLPEIVTDGVEGRLVPVRDAAALAVAMVELARDPEGRRRMGAAGRERVLRQFTLGRMLDAHEALLWEVARRS